LNGLFSLNDPKESRNLAGWNDLVRKDLKTPDLAAPSDLNSTQSFATPSVLYPASLWMSPRLDGGAMTFE